MKTARILLVEDDELVRTLLAEMLVMLGHVVCATASTEYDAVKAASRCAPDLLIVDIQLGEGNGISAIEAICGATPVPYILMTGARPEANSRSAAILHKPFREADLVRALEVALR